LADICILVMLMLWENAVLDCHVCVWWDWTGTVPHVAYISD